MKIWRPLGLVGITSLLAYGCSFDDSNLRYVSDAQFDNVNAAGSAGTAGASGAGASGGVSGAAGTSAGQSGAAGTAGASGTAGAAGMSGAAGSSGSAGSAGTAGMAGSAGMSGAAGMAGMAGSAGSAGAGGDCTGGEVQCGGAGCVDLNSNNDHCGFCNRKCFDNHACQSGSCDAYEIDDNTTWISEILVKNGYIYWADKGAQTPFPNAGVHRRKLDLSEAAELIGKAAGTSFDAFTVTDDNNVYASTTKAVAPNHVGGLWFADTTDGSTSMTQITLQGGFNAMRGVASHGLEIFWTGSANPGKVLRTTPNGMMYTTNEVDGQTTFPQWIHADKDYVYWTQTSPGQIIRAGHMGNNRQVLLNTAPETFPDDVVLDLPTLIYTTGSSSIIIANAMTSQKTKLIQGSGLRAMCAHGDWVYYAFGGVNGNYIGRIRRDGSQAGNLYSYGMTASVGALYCGATHLFATVTPTGSKSRIFMAKYQ